MILYEKDLLLNRNIKYIIGIDEVGRGPLAGPLVVGGVILNIKEVINILEKDKPLGRITTRHLKTHLNIIEESRGEIVSFESLYLLYKSIKDSKKLTESQRNILSSFIHKKAIHTSLIEISPQDIDTWGMSVALQQAFFMCATDLIEKVDKETKNLKSNIHRNNDVSYHILTDAIRIERIEKEKQTNIIKGDSKSITIASASIIAKVYRDNLMIRYHEKYPEYGFNKHKGYGTKYHLEAIKKYGACEIHRKSFAPLNNLNK